MRKRFVLSGMLLVLLSVSCRWSDDEREGHLVFAVAAPVDSEPAFTRAERGTGTDDYLLSVRNVDGTVLYEGRFGSRPDALAVPSGTYEVSVVSRAFDAPDFNSPQYGDSKMVVVSNGQTVRVDFLCVQLNGGIRLSMTERFVSRYSSHLILDQKGFGNLKYDSSEEGIAYFNPGDVGVYYVEGDENRPLFARHIGSGELHNLSLDASSDESESEFTITVDDSVSEIRETLIFGDGHFGGDGSSSSSALPISSVLDHVGDTVWVWGFIVGELSTTGSNFDAPFNSQTHLAIAPTSSCRMKSECFAVGLPSGGIRDSLNLVTNAGNLLGRRLTVRGKIDSSYFKIPGTKKLLEYVLGD